MCDTTLSSKSTIAVWTSQESDVSSCYKTRPLLFGYNSVNANVRTLKWATRTSCSSLAPRDPHISNYSNTYVSLYTWVGNVGHTKLQTRLVYYETNTFAKTQMQEVIILHTRSRSSYWMWLMWGAYQFQVNVNDDNYDACKTAIITISGRQNLAKWALTCYGGSTHERLLSESSRSYILAYYLSLYVLLLCIWREVLIVSKYFNLTSVRENIMP
jgi:hypothetical protein